MLWQQAPVSSGASAPALSIAALVVSLAVGAAFVITLVLK